MSDREEPKSGRVPPEGFDVVLAVLAEGLANMTQAIQVPDGKRGAVAVNGGADDDDWLRGAISDTGMVAIVRCTLEPARRVGKLPLKCTSIQIEIKEPRP
jgi:hypothetical protein